MGKREILVGADLTVLAIGGGFMTQVDHAPMFYSGLALVVIAFAGLVAILFEEKFKAIPVKEMGIYWRFHSDFITRAIVMPLLALLFFAAMLWVTYLTPSSPDVDLLESAPPPIIAGIPVERITGFYEDSTEYEASLLVQPFVGARVEAKGIVKDIYSLPYDGVAVALGGNLSAPSITLIFEKADSVEVVRLAKGDLITAECIFDGKAGKADVTLDDCRLAQASP